MLGRSGFILFLLLGYSVQIIAQSYALDSAIILYENKYNIKFSYDADLVSLIDEEFEVKGDLNSFIQNLERKLPLAIENVSEDYYSLVAKESLYTLKVIDSLDEKSIDPSLVVLAVNNRTLVTKYKDQEVLFEYRPNISDTLAVYSIGYKIKYIPIRDLLNKRSISLGLTYTAIELSSVIIQDYLTKGINLDPSSQGIAIAVEDLPLLPGETDGDIFTSIAALPGVTSPDQRAGNLFIRGSFTDQTLILFDDIPIYHRGHYYGTISPYNPKIVSNVNVFRSGFHTRLGDRVGGAIVINSEKNLTNSDFDAGIGINTMYGTGYVKTALIKNKLGLSIGARKSYPIDFRSPKLEAISESVFESTGAKKPTGELVDDLNILFEDYHGKLSYQLDKKNLLTISSIYTNTQSGFSKQPTEDLGGAEEEGKIDNFGINMKLHSNIADRLESNFSSTYSAYEYNYLSKNPSGDNPDNVADNRLRDINIREEISYSATAYSLDFGIDYKWQEVTLDFVNFNRPNSQLYEENEIVSSHSFSPYLNLDLNTWDKLFVRLGLRTNYYSLLETFKIDPRLFISYELFDWLTLKGAVGQYHQYLSQVKYLTYGGGGFDNELWVLADGNTSNIISGLQSSLGAVYHQDGWVFEAEAYQKEVKGMSVGSTRRFSAPTSYFTADQWIKGVDVMLKKEILPEADIWVSYTYSESEITLDTSIVSYTSKYVQPHILYIGSSYDKNNWSISASWKLASGLLAKSLEIHQVENTFSRREENITEGISGRYPNMQSLDISASYRIPQTDKHKWSASFGMSLINILNQKNQIDEVYKGIPLTWSDRYSIGFAPNLMVLIEW